MLMSSLLAKVFPPCNKLQSVGLLNAAAQWIGGTHRFRRNPTSLGEI